MIEEIKAGLYVDLDPVQFIIKQVKVHKMFKDGFCYLYQGKVGITDSFVLSRSVTKVYTKEEYPEMYI